MICDSIGIYVIVSVQYGLVLYDAIIMIPKAIHHITLEALHSGHLGIIKCREKAMSAIWWPKIGVDIQHYISACQTCQHHATP